MKIESILFCVLYGAFATAVMWVGYNIMSDLMREMKNQDKEKDSDK